MCTIEFHFLSFSETLVRMHLNSLASRGTWRPFILMYQTNELNEPQIALSLRYHAYFG